MDGLGKHSTESLMTGRSSSSSLFLDLTLSSATTVHGIQERTVLPLIVRSADTAGRCVTQSRFSVRQSWLINPLILTGITWLAFGWLKVQYGCEIGLIVYDTNDCFIGSLTVWEERCLHKLPVLQCSWQPERTSWIIIASTHTLELRSTDENWIGVIKVYLNDEDQRNLEWQTLGYRDGGEFQEWGVIGGRRGVMGGVFNTWELCI